MTNPSEWSDLVKTVGAFIKEAGVPIACYFASLAVLLLIAFKVVKPVGQRLVDRLHAVLMELVKGVLDFLRSLISKLDDFGVRMEAVTKSLDALQARLEQSDSKHEQRFQGIETSLTEIKSRMGDRHESS